MGAVTVPALKELTLSQESEGLLKAWRTGPSSSGPRTAAQLLVWPLCCLSFKRNVVPFSLSK